MNNEYLDCREASRMYKIIGSYRVSPQGGHGTQGTHSAQGTHYDQGGPDAQGTHSTQGQILMKRFPGENTASVFISSASISQCSSAPMSRASAPSGLYWVKTHENPPLNDSVLFSFLAVLESECSPLVCFLLSTNTHHTHRFHLRLKIKSETQQINVFY